LVNSRVYSINFLEKSTFLDYRDALDCIEELV